jgi:predicted alpha/beta-fold hydrolase
MEPDTCIKPTAPALEPAPLAAAVMPEAAAAAAPAPASPCAAPASTSTSALPYRAPWWLPNRHLQTIVPALLAPLPAPGYRRERWSTPDQDFIELDWLSTPPVDAAAPLVVLFHGLEGGSASHYARALLHASAQRGWHGVVPHFRSCSGPINLAPRFYHCGDSAEIDWILRRLRALHPARPLLAAGVSLGGNALLRWLGEQEHDAEWVAAAAAASAPLDLQAGGAALASGFNRIYTRNFLATLKRKATLKLAQFPGLFDRHAMLGARNLYQFDNIVTAPLHGYRDTDDYWRRAAAKAVLHGISVPTLVLNARNDPFVPASSLPHAHEVSAAITLEQPGAGGHAGFMAGPLPGRIDWLAERILDFFAAHLMRNGAAAPPPGEASHVCSRETAHHG